VTTLERRLGPLDAAAIIVSNVIGGGILFTPPQVAASVPAAFPFLATWIAGGLLAFAGAMSYAELAAFRPRAGGEYVYLRDAFGRLAAFLSGWTSFVAGFAGAIATSAVVLSFYLGRFIPGAGDGTPFFTLTIIPGMLAVTVSRQSVVALTAIWGLAWVHRRGVGPGRVVGNVLATLKVLALVIFVALGFSVGATGSHHLVDGRPVAITGWLLALIPVMFTYSGWNAAGYVAEEIRDPGRNVPRAFALGTAAVIALYALLNLIYLFVFSIDELGKIQGSVLDVVAERLLGATAGDIMGVVSIVSLLASVSAMTFAGPRVYFAMARDGLFFQSAARVHERFRTPSTAIVAQSLWTSVLVLTATADTLVTYTGFAITLFLGLAVLSLFVLRAREPNVERPFRAWFYPVGPALYVLVSAAILMNGLIRDPAPTGTGALIILAGIPLYYFFSKRHHEGHDEERRPRSL
jgi:basic amino acid/polyamine antiporter, APA family